MYLKKEPVQYEDMELKDIINPRSNKIILLDNNFTQDPNMIEKCKEIIDRKLEVDLNQGVNVRVMTDKKAYWDDGCSAFFERTDGDTEFKIVKVNTLYSR